MNTYLLITAIIIFACIMLNRISNRIGVPTLLAFILLGMAFGSDGILKIPFDNYSAAEQICSIALIFIMFYGGFGTNWQRAKVIAAKAILLSTIGVIITCFLTAGFCYIALHMNLNESLLIGALIASTDAASVFSILRSKKLNLKYNTASLLEVESGSNDPCAYMLTATFISIAKGSAGVSDIVLLIAKQLIFGLSLGALISVISIWLIRRIKFQTSGFDAIFVVAIALLSYALPSYFDGNGYLSAYIVGIVLGNIEIDNKKKLVNFFDGITGLMQMLIFFLLGLLSFPSKLPNVVIPALFIFLWLTFIARPLAVGMVLTPFKSRINQQLLVAWSGLRGAASIVFAIMACIAIESENDIFHIIFMIVLFSILFQGSLLPWVSRKVDMIDKNSDVMKTFNDYSEEVDIQFIQLTIPENHLWCGRKLKDLTLPPETLIVLIKRDGQNIIPDGETIILRGDVLVLSATTPDEVSGIKLVEKTIDAGSKYNRLLLSDIPKKPNEIIIMIQRNGQVIIPNGNVRLEEGDMLVINRANV